jgi:hypothetical protein
VTELWEDREENSSIVGVEEAKRSVKEVGNSNNTSPKADFAL